MLLCHRLSLTGPSVPSFAPPSGGLFADVLLSFTKIDINGGETALNGAE